MGLLCSRVYSLNAFKKNFESKLMGLEMADSFGNIDISLTLPDLKPRFVSTLIKGLAIDSSAGYWIR